MDMITFLKDKFAGQDVHVVAPDGDYNRHVGYYFWESGPKHHNLQLIRDMRLTIGLDVADIRTLCAEAKIVKVSIVGEEITLLE